MNRRNLRVFAHIEEDLFWKDETTGVITGGSPYYVLQDLAIMSNMTVSFEGFEWKENFSLTGDPFIDDIVPLMTEGHIELAGSYYYFTSKRAALVTPLFPCHPEKFNLYFHQPHFTSIRNVYFEPFQSSFTIGYAIFLPILFAFAFTLFKFHVPRHISTSHCLKEVFWWIVALHFLKNYSFPPLPSQIRAVIFSTSCYFTLLYYIYSASLTSSLKSNVQVIKTPKDLVDNAFTFYANPALRQALLSNKIYKYPKNLNITTRESFNYAITQAHVHLDHSNSFLWLAEEVSRSPNELCHTISALSFGGAPMSSGFYVRKGSFLKQLLNPKILRLGEIGLISRYKSLYIFSNTFTCTKSLVGTQESLGLRQLFSPFLLLLYSIPLVICVFIYEHFYCTPRPRVLT